MTSKPKFKPETRPYKCHACGRVVEMEADWRNGEFRQWRKSYCERTGKDVRIYLQTRK